MKIRVLPALILVAMLVGCGSQTRAAAPQARSAHRSAPYRLYTHCGIRWARIHGTFWRATPPLSDGNGNPPPGWGDPYQDGTLRLMNRTTAQFSSRAGRVTFKRTARTQPAVVCS